ncbi:MAG: hypothetical protein HY863_11550 [Chloroflexi bacterium]|nr:hypothetical protein [Chloroflexota bacterium]
MKRLIKIIDNDKTARVVKAILGFFIALAWPNLLILFLKERADPRYLQMQAWPLFALDILLAMLFWLVVTQYPRLLAIATIGTPLLGAGLLFFLVNTYAGQGQIFFIGNLFYKEAGSVGGVVYFISASTLMFVSEIPRRIPYGEIWFLFSIALVTMLPFPAGSQLDILLTWVLVLTGSAGLLDLLTDLILYIRWEFSTLGKAA